MSSSNSKARLLAYVCMPAVFCALGYAILSIALHPVIAVAQAWAGVLVADEAVNFDTNLTSIYDKNSKAIEPQEEYISSRDIEFPTSGTHYGQVVCEEIGLDCPVYWYDSDDILLYGAGQSPISLPPGYGTAVILCAHNLSYFRCLEYAQVGQVVTFKTNYCDYEYTIGKIEVYDENDLETILTTAARDEEHEQLIMYTCYPFYAISGRKTQRLTVFADRTSGIDVKWRGLDE